MYLCIAIVIGWLVKYTEVYRIVSNYIAIAIMSLESIIAVYGKIAINIVISKYSSTFIHSRSGCSYIASYLPVKLVAPCTVKDLEDLQYASSYSWLWFLSYNQSVEYIATGYHKGTLAISLIVHHQKVLPNNIKQSCILSFCIWSFYLGSFIKYKSASL